MKSKRNKLVYYIRLSKTHLKDQKNVFARWLICEKLNGNYSYRMKKLK